MLNWVKNLRVLGLPHMVVAFDQGAAEMCRNNSIVTIMADETLEQVDFRGNVTKFRAMGSLKPKIVLRLFKEFGFQTVILSDTDVVWLRNPNGKQDRNQTLE